MRGWMVGYASPNVRQTSAITSAAARRRDQWSSSGFAPRRFATMQVTIPGMS